MKMIIIKSDTPESDPHNIPEFGKTPKSGIWVERKSTYQYKTRSIINRVNYVTTFKNEHYFFPLEATEKIRLHIGSD